MADHPPGCGRTEDRFRVDDRKARAGLPAHLSRGLSWEHSLWPGFQQRTRIHEGRYFRASREKILRISPDIPTTPKGRFQIRLAALCLITAAALAQDANTLDPAYATLTKAFDALRARDYDAAISFFEKAASLAPNRADIRKNLAYTLLKTGDSEAARERFGEAMRLDPADLHLALEYAFLCYEATDNAPARKAEARRIFDRIRTAPDPELSATAATAFGNIDAPLAAGIARWRLALTTSPPTFSGLYELAQLAEQRDELDLAADSYRRAFQVLPERKSILLELARAEKARGNPEGAMAALLAASRGGETRAAELAKEQLPARYPYVYEFRKALDLDPGNNALHRELAYLLLAMSEKNTSEKNPALREFKDIVERSPADYMSAVQLGLLYLADNQVALATQILRNVMANADQATANRARMALKLPPLLEERRPDDANPDPRVLAERSYQAGFFKDAKRYYLAALEQNPSDASIALKLGWTNNLLHDDATALHWFDIARHSSDHAISTEASRAYENLRPGFALVRTTLWIYPLFSSRWNDLFGYGQIKTELNLKKSPVHPYVSIRFVGDARRSTGGVSPQNLSESAFILGGGVATRYWRGAMAWFEAGTTVSYLNGSRSPDYRGGVSYGKTVGASLAAEHGGWFVETLADSVFVSRFDNDLLNYSQNRVGYTSSLGPLKIQTFWNNNLTFDAKKQYWANFAETGPGVRFHPPGTPPSLAITLGAVRGAYLRNEGNPHRPNFIDFRAGIWYAFTK
ncbi:MAG TPA: tetratricopeptide repeat protein [Bryobacteraceae bacterium]|nr:tetratricopeptide repeat protein [Bryobacteraceae bacterium]